MYNKLQVALRDRFPRLHIAVATVCNGYSASYLMDEQSAGRGLYQEDVAVLAPGGVCRTALGDTHKLRQSARRFRLFTFARARRARAPPDHLCSATLPPCRPALSIVSLSSHTLQVDSTR